MKKRYFKANWLMAALGAAIAAGAVMAAASYQKTEQTIHSAQNLVPTLDKIYLDQLLCRVLRDIHDGDRERAAQRLDALLCGDIIRLNAELASADPQTRAYVEEAFRRIGRVRPQIPVPGPGASALESDSDQAAAQRILALASANNHAAK